MVNILAMILAVAFIAYVWLITSLDTEEDEMEQSWADPEAERNSDK